MVTIPKKPTPPPPRRVNILSRTMSAARTTARAKIKTILERHRINPAKTWAEFAEKHNVDVPEMFSSRQLTYLEVNNFTDWYETTAEARMSAAITVAAHNQAPTMPTRDELERVILDHFKLRPRQNKAVTMVLNELYKNPGGLSATLIPMPTGSGKSIVCAAVIKWLQNNKYPGAKMPGMDYSVIFVVPKPVRIKTTRTLLRAGIRGVGDEVKVVTYSELRSKSMSMYFEEREEILFDNKTTTYHWRWANPALVILDECQKVKHIDTSAAKRILAWTRNAETKWMFTSATPGVVLNDFRLFSLAAKIKWSNEVVTAENFASFIAGVGQCNPSTPNAAAMERFKHFLGPACINPPADPSKVKATNDVLLVDFVNEASRKRYQAAQDIWLEQCEKLGKIPSERGQILVAFQNFCAAEEREKAPVIVQKMLAAHKEGFAPVAGFRYVQSIKIAVAELAKAGVPRSKISIIWGGEKEIKPDEVFPVLEFVKLQAEVNRREGDKSFMSKKDRARFNKSRKFHTQRWKNDESPEEQIERERWLSNMGLRAQNDEQRQDEIDNFQEGRTEFCFFTLAAGGTGLDLDHQIEEVRPRRMFCTICYYAEEFVQAFGRCKREFTLTDVHQSAVFFRGTIVADHVAPILAKKLKSINKLSTTGVDLEDELLQAVVDGKVRRGTTEADLEVTVTDETVDTEVLNDDEDDDDGE